MGKGIKNDVIEYGAFLSANTDYSKYEIDWIMKRVSGIYEIGSGKKLVFNKSHIENEILYGYSDCGQGMSYEDACECLNGFSKETFIARNMQRLDGLSKDTKDGRTYLAPVVDGKGRYVKLVQTRDVDKMCTMTKDEKDACSVAIISEIVKLRKRLETYYKRYPGKVTARLYWIDA